MIQPSESLEGQRETGIAEEEMQNSRNVIISSREDCAHTYPYPFYRPDLPNQNTHIDNKTIVIARSILIIVVIITVLTSILHHFT
jgi:hypothetical protein